MVQQQVQPPRWQGEAVAACTGGTSAAVVGTAACTEVGTAAVVADGSVEEQQVVQLQVVVPDMAAAVVAAPLQAVGFPDAPRERLKSPEQAQVQVIALVLPLVLQLVLPLVEGLQPLVVVGQVCAQFYAMRSLSRQISSGTSCLVPMELQLLQLPALSASALASYQLFSFQEQLC